MVDHDHANDKIKLNKLIFEGIENTNENVFLHHFNNIYNIKTTDEFIQELSTITAKLNALEIFKQIDYSFKVIYQDKTLNYTILDLIVVIEEQKNRKISIHSQIDNTGQPSLRFQAKHNNIRGSARQLSLDVEYKGENWLTSSISLESPFISDPYKRWSISLIKDICPLYQSGVWSRDLSLFPSISFPSYYGHHKVGYLLSSRLAKVSQSSMPRFIRQECGHSLKSSISHTFTNDNRDRKIFPTCGRLFKMNNEISGFMGDAKFVKNTFHCQKNISLPFFNNMVFSGVCNFGFIYNFNQTTKSTNISDRFFIGMYNAISGIHKSFIGSSSYNKTGSDLYLSAGAYLTHPIPFTSRSFSDIFRLHSFIRADITSPPQKDFMDHFKTFNQRSFTSFVGCGLVANICDMIKIEFNYCCPLKSESNGLSKPGFSISFSADG